VLVPKTGRVKMSVHPVPARKEVVPQSGAPTKQTRTRRSKWPWRPLGQGWRLQAGPGSWNSCQRCLRPSGRGGKGIHFLSLNFPSVLRRAEHPQRQADSQLGVGTDLKDIFGVWNEMCGKKYPSLTHHQGNSSIKHPVDRAP
jgi:hypothetical protein